MQKRTAFLSSVLFFFMGQLHAQLIDSLLHRYDKALPQEKVYVQFDNATYIPGQTVWYKSYIMSGSAQSGLSKNFYIDWYDEQGKLINHSICPIFYGSASGSFLIPEQYSGQQIQVVAYTRWMRNFDTAFLFRKNLMVLASKNGAALMASKMATTSLRFYPEGGELVEQLSCVLAFKALNSAGMPVEVQGVIKDQNGQVITAFQSVHHGMGKVKLMPRPGDTYTAFWKNETGEEQSSPLPPARSNGVVLSIENGTATRFFLLQRSENVSESMKKVTVVAHFNGQVLYRGVANLTDKKSILSGLPIHQFPSGVVQFTLFDRNNQPFAERILLVNNEDYQFPASVHFDTVGLLKRAYNSYEIELPDSIPVNLSVSVTDGGDVMDKGHNIVSQLLLSTEIRGYVHEPAYYFSEADSAHVHADLVMLTHGWRKYHWEEVLSGNIRPTYFPRDSGYLSIRGKIDGLRDTKIKKASTINLILMAKDSSNQFIPSLLAEDGTFSENDLILFDTTKVFYQVNKMAVLPGRSQVSIKNNFFTPDGTAILMPQPPYFLTDTLGLGRLQFFVSEQERSRRLLQQSTLQEVVVKSRVKSRMEELNDTYSSGLFSNTEGYQFNMMDDPVALASFNVFAFLQSRVPGLTISNPTSFEPTISWRQATPALFVDEFPATTDRITALAISDIAYVKVIRPPFMGAIGGGAGGAIVIYTKKGSDYSAGLPGMPHVLMPGYTPYKQFYSPDYSEQQRSDASLPDLRRTLYWNPNIITDGTLRKLHFSFYNNDRSTSFELVMEGVSDDGRFVHIRKLLQ